MHDIIFTLGRTQPPHQAHFNMLANALCDLTNTGQLLHFIGSTNIPLKLAKDEKNILSVDARRDMLTAGLISTLNTRYERDSRRIPPKFAQRIAEGKPVLEPGDFQCIPLPDFSDPRAEFSEHETMATLTRPFEGVKTAALKQVRDTGIATDPAFAQLLPIPVSTYSPCYLAWALHLRDILNQYVDTYRQQYQVTTPRVAYQSANKDENTRQYILLIAAVIQFLPHDYDFELVLTPVEKMESGMSVNATDIRRAFIDILESPEKMALFIENPAAMEQTYPVLTHISPEARVALMKAMQILKKNQR